MTSDDALKPSSSAAPADRDKRGYSVDEGGGEGDLSVEGSNGDKKRSHVFSPGSGACTPESGEQNDNDYNDNVDVLKTGSGSGGGSAEYDNAAPTVDSVEAPEAAAVAGTGTGPPSTGEIVDVTITFKKETFTVSVPSASTVADLKKAVEQTKGVPTATQKLLYKGVLKDTSTIGELNIKRGAKVMLMASSVADLVNIVMHAGPKKEEAPKPREPEVPWSEMTEHKKVIEKGLPDDAEPGIKFEQIPLPPSKMLRGMLGRGARKTRLTFKKETDQLWIGTSEYTQKVPLNSIRNVKSQPIKGREEYSIVALQLGPTDKSLYFLYYVPSQYVEALKDEIMGAFEIF